MISNFVDILNGMVICFSRFKDAFDTYMINIIFILHLLQNQCFARLQYTGSSVDCVILDSIRFRGVDSALDFDCAVRS